MPTAIVTAIAIAWFEEFHIEWTLLRLRPRLAGAGALAFGAISPFNLLIRSGSASTWPACFYLTPISHGGDRLGGFGEN